MAACDLQRMAAVEQLKQIAQQIEVDIYADENKTALIAAKEAKQKAIEGMYDVVLIDTAGRLAIDEELMQELKSLKDSIEPDEIFYVADSMTGQDAVRTATTFKKRLE